MSAYDAFAPIYDVWASDMTEDVDFYVELAREADGPVVELAVGSGRVAIPRNAFVFDPHIAVELDGEQRDQPVPHRTDYTPADNRVDIALADGGGISAWWVSRSEWEGLLDVSGLETEALYGWFDRLPFDDESREFVWVARKPGAPHAPDAPLAVPGRRGQYE